MLDEPSQGIMPKLVDEIFQAVKRIRDAGMTVLIVEQRIAECLEIADRAYILQTGRLLMQGTVSGDQAAIRTCGRRIWDCDGGRMWPFGAMPCASPGIHVIAREESLDGAQARP